MANSFNVLGITPYSTEKERKSAFFKLVKIHHPDCGGDAKKFIELKLAWNIVRQIRPLPTHKTSFFAEYQSRGSTIDIRV